MINNDVNFIYSVYRKRLLATYDSALMVGLGRALEPMIRGFRMGDSKNLSGTIPCRQPFLVKGKTPPKNEVTHGRRWILFIALRSSVELVLL